MAAEWLSTTIGEQVTLQRGVDITKAQQRAGAIPVVSSSGVSSFHDTPGARGPGVVLGRKGVVGSVYFVPSDYWPHDTTLWVTDFHGNEPRFVYYFFKWQAPLLASMDVGSANPTLNRNHVHPLSVSWPPLDEQRAIANTLGALDDKIELNRRMNETLEATARALFKSWFVDEPETHWQTAPLAQWVDVLSGGTPSKTDPAFWGGTLKWISPKAMTSIHADDCEDHVTEQAIGNGTRLAPKGSTLVMVRGMGLHDGVRVSQAREDLTFNQDVKALVPRAIEPDLLLFAMLNAQQDLHRRVETSGHGTGKLPSELLLTHPITMPAPDVQRERAVHISTLNDRIAANREESRTLTRIRDELLPRLLSGRVRIELSGSGSGGM